MAHRRDALVRREELRAVRAVNEPHPQAHVPIRKHARQHGIEATVRSPLPAVLVPSLLQ